MRGPQALGRSQDAKRFLTAVAKTLTQIGLRKRSRSHQTKTEKPNAHALRSAVAQIFPDRSDKSVESAGTFPNSLLVSSHSVAPRYHLPLSAHKIDFSNNPEKIQPWEVGANSERYLLAESNPTVIYELKELMSFNNAASAAGLYITSARNGPRNGGRNQDLRRPAPLDHIHIPNHLFYQYANRMLTLNVLGNVG